MVRICAGPTVLERLNRLGGEGMLSIMVANAKGGCGKTTIATNLASAFASTGLRTGLADSDRQKSSLAWLKQRPDRAAPISPVDWRKSIDDPPRHLDRLVIDTGAGLAAEHARDLLRHADLIVMPVVASFFDEKASRGFLKKIERLKPVRKGLKNVVLVANRVRGGARARDELDRLFGCLGHEPAAVLRERAVYRSVAEQGLGIFDLPPSRRAAAVADWLPLIRIIEQRDFP